MKETPRRYRFACATFVGVWFLASAAAAELPITVDVARQAALGHVVVETDLAPLFPLSQHDTLEAVLCRAGSTDVLRRTAIWPGLKASRIGIDMLGLPAGDYQVTLTLRDKDGNVMAASPAKPFTWAAPAADAPAAQSGLKCRNSLVMELLSTGPLAIDGPTDRAFFVPHDSWVSVRCVSRSGAVDVRLTSTEGEKSLLPQAGGPRPSTREAMHWLPKGRHAIRLLPNGKAELDALEVLAIPELAYVCYPEDPHLPQSGVFDWAFLEQYMFPNVNTMVALTPAGSSPHLPAAFPDRYRQRMVDWAARGKHWLFDVAAPGLDGKSPIDVVASAETWRSAMSIPLAAGIIVDEFPGGSKDERFAKWTETLERVYADPQMKEKRFYAYKFHQPWVSDPESKAFFDALIRHNGVIVEEWYPTTRPKPSDVDGDLAWYRAYIETWQKSLPAVNRHLAMALGYMTVPIERLHVDPSVDFKVHMDMHLNAIANGPDYLALFGLQWYKASYSEEEYVRWGSRLLRHYAIEGKRNLLSNELGFEYHLSHIDNPNFEDGTNGWTLTPAEKDSMAAKRFDGFGTLSGNYMAPGAGPCDALLWMRRTAGTPNVARQTIRHLQPGRHYSAKMLSADYGNLIAGKSERGRPTLTLSVDGDVAIRPDRCFCQPVHAHGGVTLGPFNGGNLAWLHYHQVLFEAKAETAELQIAETPETPAGRESVCNFIQVQPYYGE